MTTRAVTFTFDLEDHRPDGALAGTERYPDLTRRVLDFLDERSVRGTFFVVGTVAEQQRDLVREVSARGHELGLHGWQHVALTDLVPDVLRADVARGKALLEDISGAPVRGFRAPMFSLVERSRWAVDVIADAGFEYSSSVLPARSPLFGDATLPRGPFRWANRLVELPCPVLRVGTLGLPYLGGVYLRALPMRVSRSARGRAASDCLLWIYCHPYDFDADEPYWVVPDVGRVGSRLLWYNRRGTFARVDALLQGGAGAPLGERVDALGALPTVARNTP